MSETSDPYAFDKIPHCNIPFNVDRSQFISKLVTEFLVYSGKGEGGSAYKLSDLGIWPDEQIAMLMPYVIPSCKITIQDGFIYGQSSTSHKHRRLFPLDSPALTAFNMFNGELLISEVSQRLAQETGWETERSFAYVRGLFLSLVCAEICLPKG
jgi:hypothetical protein